MSIIDNYEPVKYTGNGVTKNFAFNFRGFDETYIKVRLEEIATGIQTLLTFTTDYNVTLDEKTASGTVSLLVAPTSDYYIILTREMNYEQIVPYSNSRSFDAERIETSFDKSVALSQENREKLNRSVTLPVGTTGINLTIPVPVANRCIKYNAAGDNLEVSNYDPDEMVGLAEGFANDAETSSINAGTSETNALNSANLAESWAIDNIGDRPEGSSKYWAEQSALSVTGKANVDLMNTNFITNGILSAPNGVATYSGLELQLPAGTVLACPDGINADGTRKSIVVTTASLLTVTTTAVNGVSYKMVYVQASNIVDRRRTDTTYYYEQSTTPTGMSSGALWYNNSPSVNKCYQYNGSIWVENPFVVIADFSYTGGAISDFNAVYPVELVKKNDNVFIQDLAKVVCAPKPTASSIVGQWKISTDGYLPLGGTWAYFYMGFNYSGQYVQDSGKVGIAAGGSSIGSNTMMPMLCWKIA